MIKAIFLLYDDGMKTPKNPIFWARLSHWLVGFFIHVSFSISALVIAIKDWDKDCEDNNSLQISGSGWLITCEVVSVLYALLLLPGFLWWESNVGTKVHKKLTIALKIYFVIVVVLFTLFFLVWDTIGVFLLFEEIETCRGSGLWTMSVITLVRTWIHFLYPISVIIFREIETYWCHHDPAQSDRDDFEMTTPEDTPKDTPEQ